MGRDLYTRSAPPVPWNLQRHGHSIHQRHLLQYYDSLPVPDAPKEAQNQIPRDMNAPLPTDYVLLVKNDGKFLLDLLTLLHPDLRWSTYGAKPNKKYVNGSNNTVALFKQSNCLTYLTSTKNQQDYYPSLPRFTGPELLRKFVFGEGMNQEFLTRNKLIALGPLTNDLWNSNLMDCSSSPYWNFDPEDSYLPWEAKSGGTNPNTLLYALPYEHPLILKHVERVLGIKPTLKPEIIPPRKPVLDDIFSL